MRDEWAPLSRPTALSSETALHLLVSYTPLVAPPAYKHVTQSRLAVRTTGLLCSIVRCCCIAVIFAPHTCETESASRGSSGTLCIVHCWTPLSLRISQARCRTASNTPSCPPSITQTRMRRTWHDIQQQQQVTQTLGAKEGGGGL